MSGISERARLGALDRGLGRRRRERRALPPRRESRARQRRLRGPNLVKVKMPSPVEIRRAQARREAERGENGAERLVEIDSAENCACWSPERILEWLDRPPRTSILENFGVRDGAIRELTRARSGQRRADLLRDALDNIGEDPAHAARSAVEADLGQAAALAEDEDNADDRRPKGRRPRTRPRLRRRPRATSTARAAARARAGWARARGRARRSSSSSARSRVDAVRTLAAPAPRALARGGLRASASSGARTGRSRRARPSSARR